MSTQDRRFPNELIRASAGTGKTFQLSNRFIGLAAAGEPLDTILATTFTRKGAGEILDRILSRLAEAASSPQKAAGLAAAVGEPALDQDRCRALMRDLVCGLHRLRVGTLDSFFIQVARSFSLELDMPPGWRIVDEIADERLKAEAVRAVLQEESTAAAVRLMNLLFKGEASRSVAEEIAALVRELYSVHIEAPAEAWRALPRPKPLGPQELAAALVVLAAVELPGGKNFAKTRAQDLQNAEREDWQAFLAKGIGKKLLEGDDTFGRQKIPADLKAAYEPLVRHAQAVLIGRIANQTEATGRLLEKFAAEYERLKTARQAMRFEDVTRRLAGGRLEDRIADLAWRLDAGVSHLLLDEFQDTDPMQWRAVRPLAEQICRRKKREEGSSRKAGRRHSFFSVGDVKQAIFGWRGGVAEIFDTLAEEIRPLDSRPLTKSYRSSQVVIDTVNRVFENLLDNEALRNYPDARRRWAARFEHHTTAKADLPGHCRLVAAAEAGESQTRQEATLRFAAAEIARLHRQAPGFSVGVLVRTNAALARLIYELRKLGVEASEEGGNPLTDSPAVQVVLALLTLADHPGDETARFLVANSPLADAVGLARHDDAAAAVRLSRRIRRSLMEEGYGRTILAWVEPLSAYCDPRDQSRLVQLVEMVYGYEASATCRTDDFIRVVSRQRVEDPSAAAIRVMTLYKAKGLQFDVVVLPELDAQLAGPPPPIVVGRPRPTAAIDHVLRYVSKDERELLPARFRETFLADETRRVEEALCVLYVGLTRPVHALHMIVSASRPNERSIPGTLAGVLRAALGDGRPAAAGSVLYEHGDPNWPQAARPKAPPAVVAKPPKPLVVKLAGAARRATRGLDYRSPSQLEGGPKVDLASRLRLESAAAMERGALVHAWFEQIEWLDDGPPQERRLLETADRLGASQLDVPALLAQFRETLGRPAVAALLRRSTYGQQAQPSRLTDAAQEVRAARAGCGVAAGRGLADPHWVVSREYPFAVRDGDAILRGSIDRLVILYDGPKAVGADVIDFKTDAVSADDPETLAARVELYRPQLEAYHRAAARLLGLEPESVSARLAFVEPGLIHAVSSARGG